MAPLEHRGLLLRLQEHPPPSRPSDRHDPRSMGPAHYITAAVSHKLRRTEPDVPSVLLLVLSFFHSCSQLRYRIVSIVAFYSQHPLIMAALQPNFLANTLCYDNNT